MSSCSLNITLNSWVSEQACLPLSSPVRACVCSVGSKGLLASLTYNSAYAFLRFGFFFRSLLARRRKVLSGSIFHIISAHNGLNKFIRSGASYRLRVLFRFQYPRNQFLASALPVGKISCKIPHLMHNRWRKLGKKVFNMFYFLNCSAHENIIAQVMRETGDFFIDKNAIKGEGKK